MFERYIKWLNFIGNVARLGVGGSALGDPFDCPEELVTRVAANTDRFKARGGFKVAVPQLSADRGP